MDSTRMGNTGETDPLQAATALRLAADARRAARRPQPLPPWFGPVVGGLMAVFVSGFTITAEAEMPGLTALIGAAYVLLVLGALTMQRRQTPVLSWSTAYLGPTVAVVVGVCAAGGLGWGVAWGVGLASADATIVAGVTLGLSFWLGATLLNRRVHRDRAQWDA
jgi:enoyl-CoA hydratase/carnithine racemase